MTKLIKATEFFFLVLSAILIFYTFFLPKNVQAIEEIDDPSKFKVDDYLLIKDEGNSQSSYFISCGKGVSHIGCYAIRLVNILVTLIGVVAFGILVFAGFTIVTSMGNDTQLQKGKDMILYAIIGIIVALSSYIITLFVQRLFYI